MKDQDKKGWIILVMTVFLIFAYPFLGIAQKMQVTTNGPESIDISTNQRNVSNVQSKSNVVNENDFIFYGYERMPTFPGGEKGLYKFITLNLRYPIEDKEKGIEGKVLVRFIVRKTGEIENAEVVRSVSNLIDEEALRIVSLMPDFIPGEQGGQKVDIVLTLPILFKINSKIKKNIYNVVEKMPQFPGGESALCTFIARNLHYPPIEGCGIQGKIILRFVITESGFVSDVEVIRSFGKDCDNEAVRVVEKLPKWIPGEHNGQKVAVYYTLPIAFKME